MLKFFYLSLLFVRTLNAVNPTQTPYVIVLGIAQDGGLPHAQCQKSCCKNLWGKVKKENISKLMVSFSDPFRLEIIDLMMDGEVCVCDIMKLTNLIEYT